MSGSPVFELQPQTTHGIDNGLRRVTPISCVLFILYVRLCISFV